MKKRRLLDTFAVLAWLQDEPSAARVEALLEEGRQGKSDLLVTLINLGELHYVLRRRLTAVEVKTLMDQILDLPLTVIPVTEELVWDAAEVKAANPLSYADSFTVAAARREGASIVTGDPEFKRVEGLVKIEWLRRL